MCIHYFKKNSCCLLAAVTQIYLTGFVAAESSNSSISLAQKEIARRQASVEEGQILLLKGDEAYQAGNYQAATQAYAGAREIFPNAPASVELRAAATQRYAQAAVEHSRSLARKGDLQAAKTLLDSVLLTEVAPDDAAAKAFRAELDDPIRSNPTLNKEHAANVDEVRRLLYLAQGEFDLGKFDQASAFYEKVLRIDPHNTSARRGMERLSSEKSNYYKSANDQTRAELLGQIDKGWELPLSPQSVVPELLDVENASGAASSSIPISEKISRIIIPSYRIEGTTINEAIELLRIRSAENDSFAINQAEKGFNIVLNIGDPNSSPAKEILQKNFDLQLNNVPAEKILSFIASATGTSYRVGDYAVTFTPSKNASNELVLRTYRVPPDFLSRLTAGAPTKKEEAEEDVFNTEIQTGGLLATRMGVQEAFEQQGVSFPEGANASISSGSNVLSVRNSPANLEIIQQIIDSVIQTEPITISVKVTMIKVEQQLLEELGYDWMMQPSEFGNMSATPGLRELSLVGGTTGSGTAITDMTTSSTANPITAGNRSGDAAFSSDSIDSLIASGSGRQQPNNRAPGALAVKGYVNNATIEGLLRGLNQKKGADVLAQPMVTTRSGQSASILIVDEFLYPTEYEPPELPQSVGIVEMINASGQDALVDLGRDPASFPVTPATPTAFEKRDVGITLEILPVADENRQFVDITLNPKITDFEGFVNYGSPINGVYPGGTIPITENAILMPVFSARRANTNLTIADGATVVIGGLHQDRVENVDDKTPILGDLPLVGRFFKTSGVSHQSTVILFLVSVELLDPTGFPYRNR